MLGVKEQAIALGPRRSLVGVLAQPATPPDAERLAVVILNAGIIHRVGPNRIHVELARALASAGHLVLRFDLSGIGDSAPRVDDLPPLDAALADIREALDTLESARKVRRVVLLGLCSGADHAALYGGSDPRIVGAVLLDPSIPPTWGYRLRSWLQRARGLSARLRSRRGAEHLLSRLFAPSTAVGVDDAMDAEMATALATREVRTFLELAYQRALDRGIRMLAVFTAGRKEQHNYRTQMLDAFPNVRFGDKLQLEYFCDCDHVFTSPAQRARLTELLQRWLASTDFVAVPLRSGVGDVPADRLGQPVANIVRRSVTE
jgi:pimeloyl-ACP methyl ester carboxylesterase